jgi:hypothetical protein
LPGRNTAHVLVHTGVMNLRTIATVFACIAACPLAAFAGPQTEWRAVEAGLDTGEFKSPHPSPAGDSTITGVRIDPARFKLDIYSAAALHLPDNLPVTGWMRQHHLAAAINAGMFELKDGRTPSGYARTGGVTLNPAWNKKFRAVFVSGPDDPQLPAAAILDPDCDDVKSLEPHYRTVLQSFRMIDCNGNNVWQPSQKIWSTAALAIDGQGRVLFIHARSPWDVHEFIEILKALLLDVRRAMYLEGGPEASLAVDAAGVSVLRAGSWETGFNENDSNAEPWPLPNVIGAARADGGKP